MKRIINIILVSVFLIGLNSCEKEEVTSGTRIKVIVLDNSYDANPVSYVTVKLFPTLEDARYRTNIIDSEKTNNTGYVVFGGVEPNKEYWVRVVEGDDFGNWDNVTTVDDEEEKVIIYFDN
jgi:hypothetical protein